MSKFLPPILFYKILIQSHEVFCNIHLRKVSQFCVSDFVYIRTVSHAVSVLLLVGQCILEEVTQNDCKVTVIHYLYMFYWKHKLLSHAVYHCDLCGKTCVSSLVFLGMLHELCCFTQFPVHSHRLTVVAKAQYDRLWQHLSYELDYRS